MFHDYFVYCFFFLGLLFLRGFLASELELKVPVVESTGPLFCGGGLPKLLLEVLLDVDISALLYGFLPSALLYGFLS